VEIKKFNLLNLKEVSKMRRKIAATITVLGILPCIVSALLLPDYEGGIYDMPAQRVIIKTSRVLTQALLTEFPDMKEEEVEDAVSKMSPELRYKLFTYGEMVLRGEDISAITTPVVVTFPSQEALCSALQGLGRLIQYELHNGLDGIRIYSQDEISENQLYIEITGLRGIMDLILLTIKEKVTNINLCH